MNFDWIEYYQLSQELLGKGGTASQEAKERSAISRSYYFVFHMALAYIYAIGDKQFISSGGKKHEDVIRYFEMKRDANSQELADHLRNLRRYRNQADYDDFVKNVPSVVRLTIDKTSKAARIINVLPTKKP